MKRNQNSLWRQRASVRGRNLYLDAAPMAGPVVGGVVPADAEIDAERLTNGHVERVPTEPTQGDGWVEHERCDGGWALCQHHPDLPGVHVHRCATVTYRATKWSHGALRPGINDHIAPSIDAAKALAFEVYGKGEPDAVLPEGWRWGEGLTRCALFRASGMYAGSAWLDGSYYALGIRGNGAGGLDGAKQALLNALRDKGVI